MALTSQSSPDQLPSLDYVQLFTSPLTVPPIPVASPKKTIRRPPTRKQNVSTPRKCKKPKKCTNKGDGKSFLSQSDSLPSQVNDSIYSTPSQPPLKKKPMSAAERMKKYMDSQTQEQRQD